MFGRRASGKTDTLVGQSMASERWPKGDGPFLAVVLMHNCAVSPGRERNSGSVLIVMMEPAEDRVSYDATPG